LPRVLSDRAHSSVRWLLFLILLAVPAATLVLAQPAVAQSSDDTSPDEAELRRRANALENQRQALLRESRDLAAERNGAGLPEQLAIDRQLRENREKVEEILREEAPLRRALSPREIPQAERHLQQAETWLDEAREQLAAAPDDPQARQRVAERERLVQEERKHLDRLRIEADGDDDAIVSAGLDRHDASVERAMTPPPIRRTRSSGAGWRSSRRTRP
jgi:hypothetical protein